ncbi:response regulator transcription factor [Enterococcus sp. BWR-S5]|uniref:response regulator transcription factor n=1 Tax=Enterococcus sp. BWR-S5 TaxID=2787714 RepID=UPI0019215141|nr:response regulator transcription factor [Enterococcus sp. BWR-S5]MBL1226884.1 response regulator transcription factor [Enterococcus sp. BWR-S5]
MKKILVIEDDVDIARNLNTLLQKHQYDVQLVSTQQQALALLQEMPFDLALIDVGLPDGNGYAVGTSIKNLESPFPFIFLTAMDDEASVVTGLELGGEDYITKPFRPMELISRIKTVLRRSEKDQSEIIIDNLVIDTLRGTVHKNGQELFLSALEYRLLLLFVNNSGQILSRDQLQQQIWDIAGDFVNDNTMTVYIKRLREKIEDNPQHPSKIKTIRGLGYKLEV